MRKKGTGHACFYGFYIVFCCLIKYCRLWIVHFSLIVLMDGEMHFCGTLPAGLVVV